MRSHDERQHDPVAEPDRKPAADRNQRLLELAGTLGNAAMQRLAAASTVARKPPPPMLDDEPEAEAEAPDEHQPSREGAERYEEKERRRNRVAAKIRKQLEDEEPPLRLSGAELDGRSSLRP
jgi:hypothetical protein